MFSYLDAYGGEQPTPHPSPPYTRWDEAPILPPWLTNDPYDTIKEYFKQRDPTLPLSKLPLDT